MSKTTEQIADASVAIVEIVTKFATADYVGAVRAAIRFGLSLIPVEELKQYLSEEAVTRANIAADLAEAAKFNKG